MPKQIVSLKELQQERKRAQLVRINFKFGLDSDSIEGQMFDLAARHYLGHVPQRSEELNLIARAILSKWLHERFEFPTLAAGRAFRISDSLAAGPAEE
jgi:hypothetical protein